MTDNGATLDSAARIVEEVIVAENGASITPALGDRVVVLPPSSPSHVTSWSVWTPSMVYLDANLFMFYFVWSLAVLFIIMYLVSFNQHLMALINSFMRLYRPMKTPPPDVIHWPSVSIVKPLLGVDKQLVDNLETFFTMDYAGPYELLFCVEDPGDSALGVVNQLAEKYPKIDIRIFDKGAMGLPANGSVSGKPGDAPVIINPMVRNMVQGYENARYDFVW